MKGKAIVEQVNVLGNIVMDQDTSISTTELYNRIKTYFPGIYKDASGKICGNYLGKEFAIRVKNITYLGNPHPAFKKRIQIPDDLKEFYNSSLAEGKTPILLGIYTYEDTILFCDFNIDDYIDKKAHNSSAHVYTSDMSNAEIAGIFQKIDGFGNKITVFRPDMVPAFLGDLFDADSKLEQMQFVESISNNRIALERTEKMRTLGGTSRALTYAHKMLEKKVVDITTEFFANEEKVWNGIDCYRKMIDSNYRNKYQPEWAGFFLEYEFETYIEKYKLNDVVTYAQDKSENGIDLDLYFPELECYGDLKAHSEYSKGIQGNDWETVFSLLDDPERENHIYYIVCEHSTTKDSECGYVVTRFWNTVQNKKDLMSYSKRMKNSVELKKAYILDINPNNKQYLSVFKQGVNSNGKLRAPKIMIDHDNLDKFIIMEMNL